MDLQDSFYQKKLLSPKDDWDLIYKEALEARKDDEDYKRKIIGLTQKALQEADLINRSDKASTGILKLANLFNQTPRKGLAASAGFALAVLAWSIISLSKIATPNY